MDFPEELQGLVDWLSGLEALSKTSLVVGLAIVAGILFPAIKYLKSAIDHLGARRKENRLRSQEDSVLRQSFSRRALAEAQRNFIEMSCANLDPTKELNLRGAAGVQEPIMKALDRELHEVGTRFILVLADSGMGKTTLLMNMLARDLKRKPHRRRGYVLVSLALDDSIERISGIPSKSEKYLLLDAFDEDASAIENHRERLSRLVKAANDFAGVIITCRTQFFPSDEEIPREVGVIRVGARPAGISQAMTFRKIYLLPYSYTQVERYLDKAIPFFRLKERRASKALVRRLGDLANRPMLLSIVPGLVEANKDVRELFGLYAFMVERWFEREKYWIERSDIDRASKLIAVNMVLNRTQRGSECLPSHELTEVLKGFDPPIEKWKVEGRSLLNRDSDGRLKFSHRTIMEYLYIAALIDGDRSALTVHVTDQMRDFFFSWGRFTTTDESRLAARKILDADLRACGLLSFPRHQQSKLASVRVLEEGLKRPVPRAIESGFPAQWSSMAVKAVDRGGYWAMMEFSDDLIWHIPKSLANHSEAHQERRFNFDDVYGIMGDEATRKVEFPWRKARPDCFVPAVVDQLTAVTLDQFIVLFVHLARSKKILRVLSPWELYWLSDGGEGVRYLINVRPVDARGAVNPAEFFAEKTFSIEHSINGNDYEVTLYDSKSARSTGALILSRYGGAQEYFFENAVQS